MASPFSVFRKHQKFLMALACLLAIIAFVFLPILGDTLGLRSGRPENKVVVTSKYGDLRESSVSALLRQHRAVLGVLTEVGQMAGEYGLLARHQAEAAFGPATEEQVVTSWLLTKYAQQLGMVVSDEQIKAFLKRWTRDAVKTAEFQAAFKRSGLSEIQFLNLMGDELLAQQLQRMFYVSLEGITPAERWDYFLRVKQMAAIEAVPLAVADYLGGVDDPSDEELSTFFDEHKEEYPLPALARARLPRAPEDRAPVVQGRPGEVPRASDGRGDQAALREEQRPLRSVGEATGGKATGGERKAISEGRQDHEGSKRIQGAIPRRSTAALGCAETPRTAGGGCPKNGEVQGTK